MTLKPYDDGVYTAMTAYTALQALTPEYLMKESSLTMRINLSLLEKAKLSCPGTTNNITLLEVLLSPWSASFQVAVILFPSVAQASSPKIRTLVLLKHRLQLAHIRQHWGEYSLQFFRIFYL